MFGRSINKVGVIGSGNIGPDIALYFSKVLHRHDVPVVVVDIAEAALKSGEARVKGKIGRGVRSKSFKEDEAAAMIENITWTSDYSQLEGADFVIEAATEDRNIKGKIFAQLEDICPETAIMASNSSHLEPEVIFAEARHKNRCAVIHYFFPAERSIMVEIVPGKDTSEDITDFLMKFYEQIGKAPIQVKSRYGYAVDPIFEGLFLAAARMVEQGIGSVKQMDAMVQRALGQGIGPFTAMTLTGGNPITQHGLNNMHEKINAWFKSPPILDSQVASGKFWETAPMGESVGYSESVFVAVSERIQGAYFGLACEIVDAGIASISDLEMAVDNALVMNPPFAMMNKLGIQKSLELVKAYAQEWPDFCIPEILKKQAESGKPWDIPLVLRADRDDIAVLTIRRPKTLNALNKNVMNQLRATFSDIKADDSIKGVVLTGFGVKAFVSGADINMLARLKTPQQAVEISDEGHETLQIIEDMGKPVVCAMNGLALGGGLELAMACTARIAKTGMKVLAGQPEPRLGIIPGYGGTQRLPRIIGLSQAWPLLRTGATLSSADALKYGLINEEVEGDIKEAGVAFVKKIIAGEVQISPFTKDPLDIPDSLPEVDLGNLSRKTDEIMQRTILEGAKMPFADGLKHEAQMLGECVKTKDMRIGMETFMKFGPKQAAKFSHV